MARRTLVTLHLPLEMGAAGRIMQAVAREYPHSVVGEPGPNGEMRIMGPDEEDEAAEAALLAHGHRRAGPEEQAGG